jgi:hypothetical protein
MKAQPKKNRLQLPRQAEPRQGYLRADWSKGDPTDLKGVRRTTEVPDA